MEQSEGPIRRDRHTRPGRSGKNSLCCALLKCASFFYFKMCIIVSCSARATSAWWPAAGLAPARLPRSRRAQAHSGGAGPGAPAHGQVDVDGHVQQRQAVAAGAASKRPGESGATGGSEEGTGPSCWGRMRGMHRESPKFGRGSGALTGGRVGGSLGMESGMGSRLRAVQDTGVAVRRALAHLTGLCSVATGSGLSWDSGAAARPGESPASMGNLRPCGGSWALMSRPRGTLRRDGQSGSSWAAGCPHPLPPPGSLLTCRRPRPVPGWKQLPEPWPREDASVQAGPGRCLRRAGPGLEGEGCIVTGASAR